MMRIILCEGKTDAILLSYYLERTKGWHHNKNPKKFRVKFSNNENRAIYHYIKDDNELAICAVGGKDNFINFYKEYIEQYIVGSENPDIEYKIAIVIDKDNRTIKEIEEELSNNLSPSISSIVNKEWRTNIVHNEFKQEITIFALCVAIPKDQQGALENLLLDALSEDKCKENIINKSKHFVESIVPDAKEIISTERLVLKTKLGVSLAVLYPEKVFSLIDEQLKSIHWEKSKIINECFKYLVEI